MPDIGRLAAFAAISFVIIVVPGPSVLFVVSRGVAFGRRAALTTVIGNELGLLLQVIAVALGLGAVVERSIAVFTVVKLAGAAYLIWLGVDAIRHRRQLSEALDGGQTSKSGRRIFREGLTVGVTNPKSIILFAAILPQFVDRSNGHTTAQLLVLGMVAVLIALLCDSAWGLLAGTVRAWLRRSPRWLTTLRATGGVVMIGLGVRLAVTGRKD
jgi:threonine/homoserine/homoserine lactone efflux protein